ncbi:MAG: pyridoxal-phosphate dependent enzyme [Planctomycetota bacterium]|nr:MAG: pyridoxal-phosphate dependent enzyme [Planctomycetota bacterium]
MKFANSVLELIGNTPLIRLNKLTQGIKPLVLVKAEFMNPGSSVKDRIGYYMIEDAEKEGRIKPGGTIIESTSGNTGFGLALTAAVKGYKCIFTLPDKVSDEKINLLKALGARVEVCPTKVSPDDPRSYYSVAKRLEKEIPNSLYINQYHNQSNPKAHYLTTGPEIWEQTEGKITHFVCCLGTGGTITGIARYLKEKNEKIRIIGVDPVGSIYYEYWKTKKVGEFKPYLVEGIGEDVIPSSVDLSLVDDMMQVEDKECFDTARRMAKEEGIFAGGSSGGAVSAALRLAKELEDGVIVALLPDTGERYLSKVYNDEWLKEHGLL